MKKLLWIVLLLLTAAGYSQAQTVGFNFSSAAHPVSGWVNVAGDPSSSVITHTDAASGISISSVATANWSPFGNCAYDGGGASGSNPFFPTAVMANHWFNYSAFYGAYNALMPQLVVSGLKVDSVYTFKMTGSYTVNVPGQFSLNPIRYTVAGATLYGYVDIDGDSNVTAGATFHNVAPDSAGKVRIYVNTYGGSNVASICGVQIIPGHTSAPSPTVTLTSPRSNAIVPEDGNVTLTATATETGGTIARVEFYSGSSLIGSDSAAPYTMTWFSPDPGPYTITARAIDGTGNISTTSVNITVESLNYFWSTTGNIATGGDTSFIGTVDTNRLSFRTNDVERMSLSKTGMFMLGTETSEDSALIHGTLTIRDTQTLVPLTLDCNNIYSPFINMINTNPGDGASIGTRYFNDSGLVAQFFSGSYHDAFVPNGYAFHDISGGGFEFVSYQPHSYVSWGSDFKKRGGSKMIFYPATGHLIIGSTTDSGNNKLQVNGNTWTTGFTMPTGAAPGYVLTSDSAGNASWQAGAAGASHWSHISGTTYDSADNVGIGTNNTQGYRLAVNGQAIFTKVVVKPQTSWPDYVFGKDYVLPSLETVEQYIRVHNHLPGILSAAEIGRHGIDLGGQQTALLKKVEELTLYLIRQNQALTDQNKQIIDQNKQLTEQNTRLEAQQKEIDALKALITEKKH